MVHYLKLKYYFVPNVETSVRNYETERLDPLSSHLKRVAVYSQYFSQGVQMTNFSFKLLKLTCRFEIFDILIHSGVSKLVIIAVVFIFGWNTWRLVQYFTTGKVF